MRVTGRAKEDYLLLNQQGLLLSILSPRHRAAPDRLTRTRIDNDGILLWRAAAMERDPIVAMGG